MARSFRKSLKSIAMMGILGLALIALVVTGFGTGGMGGITPGGGGDELARVDGQVIAEPEVTDQVNRQFRRAQQEQPELGLAQFLAGGAFDEILNQLIAGRAMTAFGREQGVAVSQRMIDREILEIPAFRNFAGQFDEQALRAALRREGVTEQQLRQDIATQLMQRQLLLPVAGGVRVPEGLALQYASLLLERRRGMIGVVPSEAFAQGIEPNPQEIAAFYQQNQARYTIPDRRVIRYALLGREQVAAQAQVSDQEIEAYYRENAATYGGQETRTLSHVVLRDEAAARAFMARLREGANFQQAAQQAGFGAEDIAFPNQTRSAFANVTSPAVADAAFSAAQGAVAGPIRSELGFHVMRIVNVSATGGRPLAAVRSEIRGEIEQRKVQDSLSELINRVEDRLGGGESFEEVVRTEGLALRETPPITATGQAPGADWQAPAELAAMLRDAFEMGADDDPVVQTIEQGQRFAVMAIGQVLPAAPPPLEQIQAQVREDLIRRRASDRARAIAQNLVERINGGTAPRQAFAASETRLPPPQPIDARRIEISQGGEQVPPPLALMFSMAQGTAKLLEAPNGAGWFVVHLEERMPGDAAQEPGLVQATRRQFNEVAGEEIAQQFVRAAQGRADVRRNDRNIDRARQRLAGGAAVD